MATEFTKGPWRVDPSYSSDVQNASGKLEIACVSSTVLLRGRKPSKKAQYANAHLIAAAPELLEALKFLRGGMECICYLRKSDSEPKCTACSIQKLIAKGEGRL